MLLIFGPDLWVCATAATFTLLAAVWFLFNIATHIVCEFSADFAAKEFGGGGVEHIPISKSSKSQGGVTP